MKSINSVTATLLGSARSSGGVWAEPRPQRYFGDIFRPGNVSGGNVFVPLVETKIDKLIY